MTETPSPKDYETFAKAPLWVRQQMLRNAVDRQLSPILIVVAQEDPDANIRQQARQTLESWGYRAEGETPQVMDAAPIRPSALDSIGIGATDDLSKSERRFQQASNSTAPGAALRFVAPAGMAQAADATGGTGAPIQRGPGLADVFVTEKKHRKFVMGEAAELPHNWMWLIFAVTFGGGFLVPVLFVREEMPVIFYLIGVGLGGGFLVAWVLAERQRARLTRDGVFVLGELTSCTGKWVTSGSGSSRSRSYQLKIGYRVRLPNGQTLDKSLTRTRNDLAKQVLPGAGTRVAVMTAGEDLIQLL
jgi:hypothetical protein